MSYYKDDFDQFMVDETLDEDVQMNAGGEDRQQALKIKKDTKKYLVKWMIGLSVFVMLLAVIVGVSLYTIGNKVNAPQRVDELKGTDVRKSNGADDKVLLSFQKGKPNKFIYRLLNKNDISKDKIANYIVKTDESVDSIAVELIKDNKAVDKIEVAKITDAIATNNLDYNNEYTIKIIQKLKGEKVPQYFEAKLEFDIKEILIVYEDNYTYEVYNKSEIKNNDLAGYLQEKGKITDTEGRALYEELFADSERTQYIGKTFRATDTIVYCSNIKNIGENGGYKIYFYRNANATTKFDSPWNNDDLKNNYFYVPGNSNISELVRDKINDLVNLQAGFSKEENWYVLKTDGTDNGTIFDFQNYENATQYAGFRGRETKKVEFKGEDGTKTETSYELTYYILVPHVRLDQIQVLYYESGQWKENAVATVIRDEAKPFVNFKLFPNRNEGDETEPKWMFHASLQRRQGGEVYKYDPVNQVISSKSTGSSSFVGDGKPSQEILDYFPGAVAGNYVVLDVIYQQCVKVELYMPSQAYANNTKDVLYIRTDDKVSDVVNNWKTNGRGLETKDALFEKNVIQSFVNATSAFEPLAAGKTAEALGFTAGSVMKLFAKSSKYTIKIQAQYEQNGSQSSVEFDPFVISVGSVIRPNQLEKVQGFKDKEENSKPVFLKVIKPNYKSSEESFKVEEIKSLDDLNKLTVNFVYAAKKGKLIIKIKDLTKSGLFIQKEDKQQIEGIELHSLSRVNESQFNSAVVLADIVKEKNEHLRRSSTKNKWYIDANLTEEFNFERNINLATITNNNPKIINNSPDHDFELTLYCAYETYNKEYKVRFRLSNPLSNAFDAGAKFLPGVEITLVGKTTSNFNANDDAKILKESSVKAVHEKLIDKKDTTYEGGAIFEQDGDFESFTKDSIEANESGTKARGPILKGKEDEDTKVLVINYKRKTVKVTFKRVNPDKQFATYYLYSGGTLDKVANETSSLPNLNEDLNETKLLEKIEKNEQYQFLTKFFNASNTKEEVLKSNIGQLFGSGAARYNQDINYTCVYEDAKHNVDVWLVPTDPDTNTPYSPTSTSIETLKTIKGVKEFLLKLRVSGEYTQKGGFYALKTGNNPNVIQQIYESSNYIMPDGNKRDFRGFHYRYISPYTLPTNDLIYYEIKPEELKSDKVLYVPLYRRDIKISYNDFNDNPFDGGNGHEHTIKYGTYTRLYNTTKPTSAEYGFDGWEVPGRLSFTDLTKEYLLPLILQNDYAIKFSPIKGYKKGTYNLYLVLTDPENNEFKDINPDNVKQEATKTENKGIVYPIFQQESLRIGSKVTISNSDKQKFLKDSNIPNSIVAEDVEKTKAQPSFSNYEIEITTNNQELSVIIFYRRAKLRLDMLTSDKLSLGVIEFFYGRYNHSELKELLDNFTTSIGSPYTYNKPGGYKVERYGEITEQFRGKNPGDLDWVNNIVLSNLKSVTKLGDPTASPKDVVVQGHMKFYLSVNKSTTFTLKFLTTAEPTSSPLTTISLNVGDTVNPTTYTFIDNPYTGEHTLDLSGKVFLGWYYDQEFTRLFDPQNKVYSDITLYPKVKTNAEVTSVLNIEGQALKGFKPGSDLTILGAAGGLLYIPNRVNGQSITSFSAHTSTTNFASDVTSAPIKHIRLPRSINSFGVGGFANLQLLSKITNFPTSITELPNSIFYNCKALPTIKMSDNITKIGASAFEGCASIANITFSTEITSIGQNAFKGASRIGSVDLSRLTKLTSMGLGVFSNSGLTYIHIPDQLTSIPEHFAESAMKLSRVKLGKNTKIIGAWAFYNCKSLIAVELGNAEMVAKESAFKNTSSLKYHSVSLNASGQLADTTPANFFKVENFIEILEEGFMYSGLIKVQLNPSVRGRDNNYSSIIVSNLISKFAFSDCPYLSELVIPEGIAILGQNCFTGNNKAVIEKVVLPKTIVRYNNSIKLYAEEIDCSAFETQAKFYYYPYFIWICNPNATYDNPAKIILNPHMISSFSEEGWGGTYSIYYDGYFKPVWPNAENFTNDPFDFGNRNIEYIGNGNEIYGFTYYYTGNKLRSTYTTIFGNSFNGLNYKNQLLVLNNEVDFTGITKAQTPFINNVIATGYNFSSLNQVSGGLFGSSIRLSANVNLKLPSFLTFDKQRGIIYNEESGRKKIVCLVNGDAWDNLDFMTTDPNGHTFVDRYTNAGFSPFAYHSIRNSLVINKEFYMGTSTSDFMDTIIRAKVNNFEFYSNLTDYAITGGHLMQAITARKKFILPNFKTINIAHNSLFGGLSYYGDNNIDLSSIVVFHRHMFGTYNGPSYLFNSTFTFSDQLEYVGTDSFNNFFVNDDLVINTTKKLTLIDESFDNINYISYARENNKKSNANAFIIKSNQGIEFNRYISNNFNLQQLDLEGKFNGNSSTTFPFKGPRLSQIISRNNTGSNFKAIDENTVNLNDLIVINDTTQTFDWTTVGVKPENIYTGQLVEHNNLKYVIANNEAYLYGYNQKQLTPNVDVPEQVNGKPVTKVLNGAFMNVVNLEKINFPTSIKSFGTKVFADSRKLKSVHFDTSVNPDALKAIDDKFFGGAMETLNIPKGVKTFSVNSILNTKNCLQSIKGPNTEALRIYNNSVISNDNNYIVLGSSSTIIGWGIKGIDAKAFRYSPINKLDFRKHPGRDLEVIGAQAFKNSELTSVVFKVIVNGVEQYLNLKEIGDEAFMDAAFLKTDITIEIPASVTYIGARAFASTNSLGELMNQNSVHIRLMGGETQAAGFHPDWKVSLSPSQIIFG